jgi:cytoskeletal protein RodZ
MTQKEIGAKLKEIRERKELSLYKASKESSLFISTIKDIEEGEKAVTYSKVLCYAEYLGYDVTLVKKKIG